VNRNITISGTDPTNPRSPGDIGERLAQMERDLKAMFEESGRLMMFAGFPASELDDVRYRMSL
jgi:hypothetical protein